MDTTLTTPRIQTFVLGDFQTNCFAVTPADPAPDAPCWIVDCGFEPDAMLDEIERQELRPVALILTHAHADHIAGVDRALARFDGIPLHLHTAERGFCADPMLNLSGPMGMPVTCVEPGEWLSDGDVLELDGTRWQVRHAPGHSPGCVILVHEPSQQAIVGDTLFAGSIGRIDFPTSNPEAMRQSLDNVLMSLDDDVTIHPGHGPATTIGTERRSNPYILGGF